MFGNRNLCPKCGCADIRPSTYRTLLDRILEFFYLVPYRCRICRKRFFRMPV